MLPMKGFIVRSIVAAVWLGLSFVMVASLSYSYADAGIGSIIIDIIVAGILSTIMVVPAIAVALLRLWIRTWMGCVFDLTAVLYYVLMIWCYVDSKYYHRDALNILAFLFCPLYALMVLGIETIVIAIIKWRRR